MFNCSRIISLFVFMVTTISIEAALPGDINVTPAPESSLEKISDFTITSGWLEKKIGVDEADVLINGVSHTAVLDLLNYDALKFTLKEPVTASGTYSVVIAENTFLMGWDNDPNPLIEFTYKVENGIGGDTPVGGDIQNIVPEGYTFTPAAGTEIPVLERFSIAASNDYFLTSASRRNHIKINGEEVNTITCIGGDFDNEINFILAKPVNVAGQYTIYVPEGTFFGYSETDNKPFVVTVKVTGGELPEPEYFDGSATSDPADGSTVPALDKIAVKFPKLTSAYAGPECENISVSNVDGTVDCIYTLTPDPDDFNEAHVMWLEFTPAITAPGDYTVSFPAQCFEIAKYPSNWYTAPFSLTFKVSDSDSVDTLDVTADAPAEYFTLSGIRLKDEPATGVYLRRKGHIVEKIVKRCDKNY